jgi:hypothetical protein
MSASGTSRTSPDVRLESANWAKADMLSDYSRSGNRLYGLPWRRTPYCLIVGMGAHVRVRARSSD